MTPTMLPPGHQHAVLPHVVGTPGEIAFRNQDPPTHTKCVFRLYVCNDNDPHVVIEVRDGFGVAFQPHCYLVLPLVKFDYVAVKCNELHRLPDIYDRWSSLVQLPKKSDKPRKYVMSIHMYGLSGDDLQWNEYRCKLENLGDEARTTIDMFPRGPAKLNLEILIDNKYKSTFSNIERFQDLCNAINRYKNPILGLSLPVKSKKILKAFDPESTQSPLYTMMGGKRRATDVVGDEPAFKKHKGVVASKLKGLLPRRDAMDICKALRDEV